MEAASATIIDDVDRARARLYRVLGTSLAGPPSAPLLAVLSRLSFPPGALGDAAAALAAVAETISPAEAADEYNALFVGVVRGELVPYASFYITGFLYDRPLARLRGDMARHELAGAEGRTDPEDHIATVLEISATLIERGLAVPEQHAFFQRHLEPWGARFFTDLETANCARLYRPVGTLGRLLVGIESDAFRLEAA